MSIIYDALKKVETAQSNEPKAKPAKKARPKPKAYLFYALIICLGLFIVNFFYGLPSSQKHKGEGGVTVKAIAGADKKEPPNQPLIKGDFAVQAKMPTGHKIDTPKESASALVLNGVFFSGNEGYALINNRIVRQGDKVDGATVTKIQLDEVELERDGSFIKISSNIK